MPEEPHDPVLITLAWGAILLSLATCASLAIARTRGPLLRFQPRRVVPWNAAGAVLACVFVVQVIAGAFENPTQPATENQPAVEEEAVPPAPDSKQTANNGPSSGRVIAAILVEATMVCGVLLLIVVYFRPTRSDLGLPASKREFAHDAFVGVVAMLAAFAPVYIIQGKLLQWLGMPETKSGHQLVKLVTEGEASVARLLLVSIAAVVIAPIFEEIVFRLLLQGWLEKWETEQVFIINDECRTTNDESPQSGGSAAVLDRPSLNRPPERGVAGLPFGMAPIAISSLLFGLAHFGYGPEPVSLFFLALVLGYVYYRTHRIVPCMVAHLLFNLYSVIGIWRIVYHGSH